MRRRLGLALLCLLALALSRAYLGHYLRGGPRVIDATSYFLEARSLAAGSFTFHVPEPTAAFRGRFLLASADGHTLGVIFPPGFPGLLSLGMRWGLELWVGPLLGALLVLATYALARALEQSRQVAWSAAALSVVCAALRYHTADTMSHGLAALLGCAALTLALRRELGLGPLLAGACLGLLVATRPVSAGVAWLLVGYTLRHRSRAWPWVVLGCLPGVALLLTQQHALTGDWLGSSQLAYYAASDAPAGCFRYGFGAGIGCRFEHGDYVARFLPEGFGARHALRNFAVHLQLFATDATNAWPLSLLGLYALGRHLRSPLALLGGGVLLQALAYLPFYFDGNYPGGGARFLCEAIPFCQILVARACCDLRVGWLAVPAALAGFGLYARQGHEALRDRQGGRPMFEAPTLARAGVTRGLVLVDSDHGFNLGHDPRSTNAKSQLVVARARGDAHDRELYERLGKPPTYRYVYDFEGRRAPALVPYVPGPNRRFEAEAEWPARLERGSAYPIHYPCASAGRALRLVPNAVAAFGIGWPTPAPERLRVGWIAKTAQGAQVRLRWSGSAVTTQHGFASAPGCSSLDIPGPAPDEHSPLIVELLAGEGALDFLEPLEP